MSGFKLNFESQFDILFMKYFASVLAYTGAIAGIQRKIKAMIRISQSI